MITISGHSRLAPGWRPFIKIGSPALRRATLSCAESFCKLIYETISDKTSHFSSIRWAPPDQINQIEICCDSITMITLTNWKRPGTFWGTLHERTTGGGTLKISRLPRGAAQLLLRHPSLTHTLLRLLTSHWWFSPDLELSLLMPSRADLRLIFADSDYRESESVSVSSSHSPPFYPVYVVNDIR